VGQQNAVRKAAPKYKKQRQAAKQTKRTVAAKRKVEQADRTYVGMGKYNPNKMARRDKVAKRGRGGGVCKDCGRNHGPLSAHCMLTATEEAICGQAKPVEDFAALIKRTRKKKKRQQR
jgi:hypothetical protein